MVRESCPFHALDDVEGVFVSDEVGHSFTCDRADHPTSGPYVWNRPVPPPPGVELTGVAAELGLDVELPSALARYAGKWVEYGVVEHAYAHARPDDWRLLVRKYGHTAIAASRYTVSAFLGGVLGRLSKTGDVAFKWGPATGRWAYNTNISWWSLPPAPKWEDDRRLSWIQSELTMDYVPGRVGKLR